MNINLPCYSNLIDSSRKLVSIYTINFIINLCLILLINMQTSYVLGFLDPNTPLTPENQNVLQG